ncbi:general transcription factor 3C polypeptide 5 [Ixodes scapularis]
MTEVTLKHRNLVLVEYPGIVRNVDKMLRTLGGIDEISETHSDPSRRLELKFRPDDPYCKCVYANRFSASCLLLKVKRNRSKDGEPYSVSIEGTVSTVYKFRGMVDFQFLPMEKKADGGGYESLLDQLIPPTMPSLDWLKEETPVFILPQVFSRLDTPAVQPLRDEPKRRVMPGRPSGRPDNVLGGTRHRRVKFACFLNHDDLKVPVEPKPEAWKQLEWRPQDPDVHKRVKEAFEERPLWTRSALQVRLEEQPGRFKLILPVVAYYVLSGPFRTSWVRLGFDPRKDPSTKPYQILDFRLSTSPSGLRHDVAPKRGLSAYLVPTKVLGTGCRRVVAQTDSLTLAAQGDASSASSASASTDPELVSTFKPGHLPPFRQLFYHLCDVRLDEVQALVHANDGKETGCHEKDGWCLEGTIAACRQIMLKDLRRTIKLLKAKSKLSQENDESLPASDEEDDDGEELDELLDDDDDE